MLMKECENLKMANVITSSVIYDGENDDEFENRSRSPIENRTYK